MVNAIKDVMTELPHTVGQEASVSKARELMHEYHCHHLPVLDGGKLVGLISDRDIQILTAANAGEVLVKDLMTDEPISLDPKDSLKHAVDIMLKEKIHSVIVRGTESSKWGIFTTTDILKLFIKTL